MTDKTASEQIDDIISSLPDWKKAIMIDLRSAVLAADPEIVEEVKWKMPSLPEGRPVWSKKGIICLAEIFKNDIKLLFFKGAQLDDPHHLFNARLNSKTDRAIEYREGSAVDAKKLTALVAQSARLKT